MESNASNHSWAQWLNQATEHIRFRPDRRAVRRELEAHLEDKALDFQRIFPELTQEEAQERAAAEMGDPAEIGRELAKIHRPFLGYLWRCSQVLVVLAGLCLGTMWLALQTDSRYELWDFDNLPYSHSMNQSFPVFDSGWTSAQLYLPNPHPDQLQVWSDGPQASLAGHTVRLCRAALWQEWQERGGRALYLYLRVESPLFWVRGSLDTNLLTITDSLGNEYPEGYPAEGAPPRSYRFSVFAGCGLFHQGTQIRIQALDPEAEWVRLDYSAPDEGFSLTLDLDEGVEPNEET